MKRACRVPFRVAAAALTLAAAPAFAQVSVSITSTPANGTHYVAGEAITTRLTIPQLNSGDVQNARMKLNIGGVERQTASTTSYSTGRRGLRLQPRSRHGGWRATGTRT